ncbi:MAG: acetyl-CoA carboxylase biotin carboxyl carrier protein subunit [Lachnospiraceae bacterium]|nr:acetyl-CoA carboxylase biotin carboxyl carrier protein subunit [Lachnospiraceae bacterium]
MKSYTITVNGNVYDVTVEEKAPGSAASTSAPQAAAAQPTPAPTPAPQPAPAAPASAGEIRIEAGAAGKVVDIVASPGASVAKGDTVVILEVMKMETPVVAPEDGIVASIEVTKGQSVAAGELLATMN